MKANYVFILRDILDTAESISLPTRCLRKSLARDILKNCYFKTIVKLMGKLQGTS